MVQLAKPTFVTGPQDTLATADVYAQTSTAVINSIQQLINSDTLDLSSVMRGGAALASALAAQLPVISGLLDNGQLAINKDNLIARLSASSGSVLASVRSMDSSLAARVGAGIPQLGSRIPGGSDVQAQVGTITQRVSAAQLTDLGSLGRTIADVTGNSGVFSLNDRSAQIGLYTGLIQEAHSLGLNNSFESLMGGVNDPLVVNQVAAQVLPSIVANSDLPSLQSVGTRLDSGRAQMLYPDVVDDFASNYSHEMGASVQDKTVVWGEMKTTFTQLDPQWNSCSRSGEQIVDVSVVQQGSDEFQELVQRNALLSTNPDDQFLLLGLEFAPTTVDEGLREHFPYTATGPEARQISRVVDPRQLAVQQDIDQKW